MKKTLLLLLVCLLIISSADAKLYIATENIKIRTGKGAHAPVIGMIKNGDSIDVYDGNSEWSKVKYDDKDGYIKTKYLRIAAVIPKYAEEATGNSFNPYTILFLIVAITAFGFIWKLFHTGENYAERNSKSKNIKNKSTTPVYWYQCKHCKAVVKNNDHPSHTGCLRSELHHWTELAEVGLNKYFCKHCMATIQTKTTPMTIGCPNGEHHLWIER